MAIPLLVFGIPVEYFWREESVKRDYDRIERLGNGNQGERAAVINLAGGCWAKEYEVIPKYFRERVVGNCRSLDKSNLSRAWLPGVNLNGAIFDGANLSEANLEVANLENAKFECVEYEYLNTCECPNLKNIKWDKATTWNNIKG